MSFFSSLKFMIQSATAHMYNTYYRGAGMDDEVRDFRPHTTAPDWEVLQNWELLVARARWLSKNSPLFAGLTKTYIDLIQGHGIMAYSCATDENQVPLKDWNTQCDNLFKVFAKQSSLCGLYDWPCQSRLNLRTAIVDGHSFLVEHLRPEREFPLCYELVEIDQLDTSKDRIADKNGVYITRGVEKNKFHQITAYNFYIDHPDQIDSPYRESVRIPAERVIPTFGGLDSLRPHQTLGVSWFAPILIPSWHLDQYWTEELNSARMQSRFLGLLKRQHNSGPLDLPSDREPVTNILGQTIKEMSGGTLINGSTEDSLELTAPNRLTGDSKPWLQQHMLSLAAGANVAYSHISRDFANKTFSSHLAEQLHSRESFKPVQNWYISAVERKIRERVITLGLMLGILKLPSGGITRFMRNPSRYLASSYIATEAGYLNPYDEKKAEIAGLASLTNTWTRISNNRLGSSRNEVLREWVDDYNAALEAGVPKEVILAALGVKPEMESNNANKKTSSNKSKESS